MFRPTVNHNQRGYDLLANAKWESLAGALPTHIRPLERGDLGLTWYKEPKTQVQSMQERERDAALSLLLMTRMSRHHRKVYIAPGSKQQHRVCHYRQQEEEHQRSSKPSLVDSWILQHQQDKRSPKTTGLDERKWNQRIEEVKEFVLQHGHGRIPVSYPENQDLARWSKRQRYHYKVYLKNKMKLTTSSLVGEPFKIERCYMTQRRLKALNDAGFCFDLHVARWDRSYQLLKRNKLCSTKHMNYELKKWIGTQRFQMSLLKQGKKSFLNPERIQKLNEIGFNWQDDEWV
jgi:hypothetical protein